MLWIKKILNYFEKDTCEMENYILSKYPKTHHDIENLTRSFYLKKKWM